MGASEYYVVGEREGGDRLVLAAAPTAEKAERLAARLRAQLEGYREVVVEHARGLTAYDRNRAAGREG